jgi:hypothetical protein
LLFLSNSGRARGTGDAAGRVVKWQAQRPDSSCGVGWHATGLRRRSRPRSEKGVKSGNTHYGQLLSDLPPKAYL